MVNCPPGDRWTLIAISENKRWLSTNIPAEIRLRILEFFDRCTDNFLTAEAIAQVEPMCDEAYEMAKEARKLGPKKALDVFAKWEVFTAFVALNPSLLTAIKMPRSFSHNRSA